MDSGADGTLLPKDVASKLGLNIATDLVATPLGSGGAAGTSFATWTTPKQITGQVVAYFPTGPTLWGPTITFSPAFAENAIPLFGRADFFGSFGITFGEEAAYGKVFHLDY